MPDLSDSDIRRRYGLEPDAAITRHSGEAAISAAPDGFHLVELPSELSHATWERPVAVAGTTIHLAVRGTFVGEGAPVTVDLHDARDRALGRAEAPMHRDAASVALPIDRQAAAREPDGILCAADVTIDDLGLEIVSAPLLVLPFAELTDAAWGAERGVEGEPVTLSCRLDGTAAGVQRLGREPAEVSVWVRTESGATPLDEPVASFRTRAVDGRIEVEWALTLGLDRWSLPSQADLDAEADRTGAPRGAAPYLYDRPQLVFRVALCGLTAESPPLAVDDWLELRHAVAGEPAADRAYTLTLADGTTRDGTLDADGAAREDELPPGGVAVAYEPEPDDVGDDTPPSTVG